MPAGTPDPSVAMKAMMEYAIRIQDESHTIHGHWTGIGRELQQAVGHASTGFLGAFNRVIGLSPALHGIAEAFKGALNPKGSTDDMVKALEQAEINLDSKTKVWRAAKDALKASATPTPGTIVMPGAKEALEESLRAARKKKDESRLEVAKLKATVNLQQEFEKHLHGISGILIPALIVGFREVWKSTFEINKAFKEATTDAVERYKLLRTTLDVQRETGASTEDINKAMQALVSHGYDLDKNLGDVAKTVTMMELGLGVSADKSAELASSFRNIGQPLVGAADGIARIQRDTALSASSAAQYYTQIARALSLLKPGSGGMAAQVGELVSQFEGASQRVLGRSGDLTKLITEMSGMEGMATAAQLGMQPDFMADPAKVKEALERLNTEVNNRLAGSSGFARVAILESLSAQYGIQKDVLANLNKIVEERNKQTMSQTTLEKEYNAQMALLGNSMSQIKNILMASLRDAFTPLVFGVSQLARGLAYLLEQTVNFTMFGVKPLAWVLTIAVGAAGLVATVQMYRLAKALYAVALAGKAAEVATKAKAGTGMWQDALEFLKKPRGSGATSATLRGGFDSMKTWLKTWDAKSLGAATRRGIGSAWSGVKGGVSALRGVPLLSVGSALGVGAAGAIGYGAGYALNKWADKARENGDRFGSTINPFKNAVFALQAAAQQAGKTFAKWWDNLPDKKGESAVFTGNMWAGLDRIEDLAASGKSTPEQIESAIKEYARSQSVLNNVPLEKQVEYMQRMTDMATERVNVVLNSRDAAGVTSRDQARMEDVQANLEMTKRLADTAENKKRLAQEAIEQNRKNFEAERMDRERSHMRTLLQPNYIFAPR